MIFPITSFVLAAAKTIVSSARAIDEVAMTPNARAMARKRRIVVSPRFGGLVIFIRIQRRRILADITCRLNLGEEAFGKRSCRAGERFAPSPPSGDNGQEHRDRRA